VGGHQVRGVDVEMDNVLGMDSSQTSQDLLDRLADGAEARVDSLAVKLLQHGQHQDCVAVVVHERVLKVDDVGQVTQAVQELELLLGQASNGHSLEGQWHKVGNADAKLDRGQVML